jgi:hypothetical protein
MPAMLAAQWHVGQVFFSLLWFSLFVIWIWLLVTVVIDIFRSRDLSGGAKGLWFLFVVFLPYLGVFAYVIVHGATMRPIGRHREPAVPREQLVLSHGQVEALDALNAQRDANEITADEYREQRERILA